MGIGKSGQPREGLKKHEKEQESIDVRGDKGGRS
jgi:hypothetical protein